MILFRGNVVCRYSDFCKSLSLFYSSAGMSYNYFCCPVLLFQSFFCFICVYIHLCPFSPLPHLFIIILLLLYPILLQFDKPAALHLQHAACFHRCYQYIHVPFSLFSSTHIFCFNNHKLDLKFPCPNNSKRMPARIDKSIS